MPGAPVRSAHGLLERAVDALAAAAEADAGDDDLLSVLTMCESVARRLDRLVVGTVATLERRGTLVERGYRSTADALADLLGWDRSRHGAA